MTPMRRAPYSKKEIHSYSCGAGQPPLRYETVGQALDSTVSRLADSAALIVPHQSIRWSWQDLGDRVDSCATAFLSLGLVPGDRLGIWAPNCAYWVVTQLAAAKAGLILVTINPAYRAPEIKHAINLAGCRALIFAERFKTSDYVSLLLEVAPELADGQPGVHCAELPTLEIVASFGRTTTAMLSFESFITRKGPADRTALTQLNARIRPDDPVCIQFTSGTTGLPKGATLTHFGLLNNSHMTWEIMGLTQTDKICLPVPLFHCFGMVVGVLGSVAHGGTIVLPGESFDPAEVMRAVEQERCTALFGVPTMFIAALAHPDFAGFDLTSLRTGAMGGAPCPADIMQRVMADMHMQDVAIVFGMTETSPVSFQTRVGTDLETRVSTVGTVHPWVEARVVDAEDHLVPLGTVGELHIRGYNVMSGYWNDPERTEQAIDPAGWMRTGDLATLDDQGRCRIVGRSKDVIIRGGENVYPVEVENFLRTHSAITDLAVFGVPDELMGEEICAWVKTSKPLTLEEIRAFCKGRIAHYKVPRYVRFVESFPMTASGKMHKPTMREIEARRR
jgi:fatty-acyl-CoA synthase